MLRLEGSYDYDGRHMTRLLTTLPFPFHVSISLYTTIRSHVTRPSISAIAFTAVLTLLYHTYIQHVCSDIDTISFLLPASTYAFPRLAGGQGARQGITTYLGAWSRAVMSSSAMGG